MPDEFTKFLLSILVSYSQPATKLCPSVGTCFSFTPVAVACHELAVTLSMWSGIHIDLIFYHVVKSLGKKKIKTPNPYLRKFALAFVYIVFMERFPPLKHTKKE